ncbi:visual pigment-like receptor peropsin isoform X1 [Hydra vulgaris]|uniref:visual pigment-like receptor peropsin isoform X1 n=1 Tax=Hydra vulgaris TaxID=6087 RepID=UPI001F5F0427|nr:visual pigment-like receptor peropsin [Hydra vulgaris]
MNIEKICFFLISTIATVINAVSLYFIYKKYKKYKSNYVILCINLSFSDLFRSVAGYIPSLLIEEHINTATMLCKLSAFFIAFTSYTTIAMITTIALSRMVLLSTYVLCNKINYKTLFIKIGVLSWIYGFTWAIMPFIGFSSYTLEDTCSRCSINFSPKTRMEKVFLILLIVFGFFIPAIIILVSCLYTAYVMRTKYKYFNATYGKENIETKRYKEKENKAFISFILMVLSFVVCWTPYALIGFFSAFTSIKIFKWLFHLAALFGKFSAFINPVIYYWKDGLFNKSFICKKSRLLQLLTRRTEYN